MSDTAKCIKCGGSGRIRAYARVSGGTCFSCGGTGRISAERARKIQQAAQRAQAREKAATARRLAALDKKEAAARQRYGDIWLLAEGMAWLGSETAQGYMWDLRDRAPEKWYDAPSLDDLADIRARLGLTDVPLAEIVARGDAKRIEFQRSNA